MKVHAPIGPLASAVLLLVVVPLAWTDAYGVSRWSSLFERGVSGRSDASGSLRDARVHVRPRCASPLQAPLELLFRPLMRLEEARGLRPGEERFLLEVLEKSSAWRPLQSEPCCPVTPAAP